VSGKCNHKSFERETASGDKKKKSARKKKLTFAQKTWGGRQGEEDLYRFKEGPGRRGKKKLVLGGYRGGSTCSSLEGQKVGQSAAGKQG